VTDTPLGGEEVVSRFLYGDRHYSIQKRRPKPGAFDPSPYYELSTAHTTGLLDKEIWKIAIEALGDLPPRDEINARVDIPVTELTDNGLRAVRDDDPFIRHALVLGWPRHDDPDQQKKAWKEICLKLSQCPQIQLAVATPAIRR
jgi:hypothetical protein